MVDKPRTNRGGRRVREVSRAVPPDAAESRLAEIEAIYNAAPVGLVLFDLEFRFLRINQLLAEANAMTAAEHLGRTVEEVLPAETAAALRAMLPRLLAGEDVLGVPLSGPDPVSGEYRHWEASYRPVRDVSGRVTSLLGTVYETTRLKAAEAQLKRSYETYLALIENDPFGVYLVDADFRLAQVSRGARDVFVRERPLIGRDFAEVMRLVWAEPFASEAIARFRHTLATGEPFHSPDMTELRGDIGATQSFDWKIERVTLPDGRFGVVCYFYDLTERQQHAEQIRLLLEETSHRFKNLLGLIGAVARHTAGAAGSDFAARFEERIRAIAASQTLLVESGWTEIGLEELVRAQLAPFADLIGDRVALGGPAVRIGPTAAQALGMALTELATNAAKYGALSNHSGRVDIGWELPPARFAIGWHEQGGPPVRPPARRGFGTTVLDRLLRANLGGSVVLDHHPAGLRWRFECEVQRLRASGDAPLP